jgi:DNA polymerase/3'-5' exonuclease PolX
MSAAADKPETKTRFAYAHAHPIAQRFVLFLARHCHRVTIAGSLRRRRQLVSDIEILFVPKITSITDFGDMFGAKVDVSAAGVAIDALVNAAIIARRPNKNGAFTWGAQNRLAIHVETGIPVDFFATTEAAWFNALVVRTGPAESNKRVASAALERGWNWHAYGDGFTRGRETKRVTSERDVFDHVGLPYFQPEERS